MDAVADCTSLECLFLLAAGFYILKSDVPSPSIPYGILHDKAVSWFQSSVFEDMLADRPFLNAFQHLLSVGIFIPVSGTSGAAGRGLSASGKPKSWKYKCMLRVEDIKRMVESRTDLPERVRRLARTV